MAVKITELKITHSQTPNVLRFYGVNFETAYDQLHEYFSKRGGLEVESLRIVDEGIEMRTATGVMTVSSKEIDVRE